MTLRSRVILIGVALAQVGGASQAETQRATTLAPNVLWVLGEDLGPEIGAYGYAGVRTPNIDRLAAEGSLYKLDAVQARLLAPTRPAEELYALDADPFEIRNLVEDPEHAGKLSELRAALDAWIVETNDQGRFAESDAMYEHYERRMMEIYYEPIRAMLEARRQR